MGLKPGYKLTEVGVIPEDWEVRTIDTVSKLINGRGFKPFEWKSDGLPIIRIQNLNGAEEFNYFQGAYDKKIEVDSGQLLFAWSGSRGTSFGPHIWPGPRGLLNYHTWKVQIDQREIDKDFYFYSLWKLTAFIEGEAHGAAALVHVQKWQMEDFEFPLPPTRAEQKAVAEALSDADALIASLGHLLAKKRHIKQGAMQELLTGRKRLPGFSGKWVVKRLRDVCRLIVDGTHFTPNYVAQGVPFYSVENLTADDFDNTKFISRAAHDESSKRCHVEKGDILLTRIGSIGDTKLIDWDVEASIYVSLALLKTNEAIDAEYLHCYSKSSLFIRDIEDRSLMNASPKKINMGEIGSVPIPVPPRDEQTAIASLLKDMDSQIATLEVKLTKARQLKTGMMQELLTGRIRLK